MTKKEFVCISCPMGCRLTAVKDESGVTVTGNTCKRGEVYATNEMTDPKRTVTALAAVAGRAQPLPVKTAQPIPKELVRRAAAQLKALTVSPPVAIGQTVLRDVCGCGVDVVATENVK